MLRPNGSLCLGDFGLARIVDPTRKSLLVEGCVSEEDGEEHDEEGAFEPRDMVTATSTGGGGGGGGEASSSGRIPPAPPPLAQRSLTLHVVSRWYRSPELVMLQPYGGAVDVWAAGCVFFESLLCLLDHRGDSEAEAAALDASLRTTTHNGRTRPLFAGRCCYPFSPGREALCSDQSQDQVLSQALQGGLSFFRGRFLVVTNIHARARFLCNSLKQSLK